MLAVGAAEDMGKLDVGMNIIGAEIQGEQLTPTALRVRTRLFLNLRDMVSALSAC